MHCKTLSNKGVVKMSREQEKAVIVPKSFVTVAKLPKITGRADVTTVCTDAEEEILFLTFLTLLTKKRKENADSPHFRT